MMWPLKFGARYWVRHWSIIVGIVAGALVLPAAWHDVVAWRDAAEQQRQESTPVIAQSSVLVSARPDEVIIHVKGERLRGDECEYRGAAAYTLAPGRSPKLANVERMGDVQLRQHTRPVGPFDGGLWRVWPLEDGATTVLIQARYICVGHPVRATLAQVSIYADQ